MSIADLMVATGCSIKTIIRPKSHQARLLRLAGDTSKGAEKFGFAMAREMWIIQRSLARRSRRGMPNGISSFGASAQ